MHKYYEFSCIFSKYTQNLFFNYKKLVFTLIFLTKKIDIFYENMKI